MNEETRVRLANTRESAIEKSIVCIKKGTSPSLLNQIH